MRTALNLPRPFDDRIPLLERLLGEWRGTIGPHYEPYKNHVYRVVHFCFPFVDAVGRKRKNSSLPAVFTISASGRTIPLTT